MISIVMTADNNYIYQMIVGIYSMRKNTSCDETLDLTILCDASFSKENKNKIIELKESLKNINISFSIVETHRFDKVKGIGHVSLCSYFRLLIPEIINADRCLFLDADMIVVSDISELYNIDLSDCYLAAVRDVGFVVDPDWALYHVKRANYDNLQGYFNAGMMLLNLKKMREDHIVNIFLYEMSKNYDYMDQDVLNKVCKGNVKYLPTKYNCFHRVCKKRAYRGELEELPVIIHYAGPYKPWNNIRVRYASLWWEYGKEVLDEMEYSILRDKAIELTKEIDWSHLVKCCRDEKEIIIVGYSLIGVRVYDSLKMSGIKAKIFFCDSSDEKHELNESVIYYIDELSEIKKNALWLITSQNYYREITKKLQEKNIKSSRIIRYFDKQQSYYEYIEDEYLPLEFDDKLKMMMGKSE